MKIIDQYNNIHILSIVDENGIDWTIDFVIDDNIQWDDESHCYRSDYCTISWWEKAIEIQLENPDFHMERIISEIDFRGSK